MHVPRGVSRLRMPWKIIPGQLGRRQRQLAALLRRARLERAGAVEVRARPVDARKLPVEEPRHVCLDAARPQVVGRDNDWLLGISRPMLACARESGHVDCRTGNGHRLHPYVQPCTARRWLVTEALDRCREGKPNNWVARDNRAYRA